MLDGHGPRTLLQVHLVNCSLVLALKALDLQTWSCPTLCWCIEMATTVWLMEAEWASERTCLSQPSIFMQAHLDAGMSAIIESWEIPEMLEHALPYVLI